MMKLRNVLKKIIFSIILCSFIISSCIVPASYAKLDLAEGDFYYGGTTKGKYVPQESIFSWIINLLGELIDWLFGIMTMGVRMVFVGYTALVEHLLTNALEIASGIKANGDEVSTTDISTLSDSSNSVTVQGIVYNMIPALDVNFFKEENGIPYLKEIKVTTGIEKVKDKNGNDIDQAKVEKKLAVVSPTGLALKCAKCHKPVRDCCTALNSEEEKRGQNVVIPDNPCGDECTCGGNCDACKLYAKLVEAEDPPVVILRTLIAVWYNIIRLLAAAVMLVLLIFVGIKTALSSVASEKAQYKRVFVDWVVGVILIMGIHYIMVFAVNINEILVGVVRDSANSVNSIQLKELASDKETSIKTDQEIEINVYDEIKTRAYDAKMTVGFSGMIMYVGLVYFSIKYTLVYLKRYLTLAVLTLMGPAIGVSYALQKVLTGKGQSFKLWLTEYILNLIIQVVHALIYAVFISAALVLSLKNVAGIIMALILMKFSLGAEGLFRRIFNLDASGKGLLSATESAGDPSQIQAKWKSLQGMALGTKPAAKLMTALPTKAVKTVGAAGVAAIGSVAPKVAQAGKNLFDNKRNRRRTLSRSSGSERSSSSSSESMSQEEKLQEAVEQSSGSRTRVHQRQNTNPIDTKENDEKPQDVVPDVDETEEKSKTQEGTQTKKEDEKTTKETESVEENTEKQTEKTKQTEKLSDDAIIEKMKSQLDMKQAISQLTTVDVLKAHVKEAFDINNFFEVSIDKNGNVTYGKLKKGLIFGTDKLDPSTGRMVKDKSSTAYNQIADKLLGLTKEDKKLIKEVMGKSAKAILGIPLSVLGAMVMFDNTKMGAAFMFQGLGTIKTVNEFKPVSRFGNFSPNGFASPMLSISYYSELAKRNIKRSEELTRNKRLDTLARHPNFVINMAKNLCKPKTIAKIGAGALGVVTFGVPAAVVGGMATASVIHSMNKANSVGYVPDESEGEARYKNRYNPYNLMEPTKLYEAQNSSMWGKIEKHHYTQLKNKIAECEQETFEDIEKATTSQAKDKTESILSKALEEIEEKQEVDNWLKLGYLYNPKTKEFVKIKQEDESDIKQKDLVKKIPDESSKTGTQIHERPITSIDVARINKEMENIIIEMSNGSQVDSNDEKTMDYVIKELSARLEKSNILSNGQNADILFKSGAAGLKTSIKSKAEYVNKEIERVTEKELDLSSKETEVISEAINSAIEEEVKNVSSGEIKIENIDENKIYSNIVNKLQPKPIEKPEESKDSKGEGPKKSKAQETKKSESKENKNTFIPDAKPSSEKENVYKNAIHIMLENKAMQVNKINLEKPTVQKPIQIQRTTREQSSRRKLKDSIEQLAKKSMDAKHEPTKAEKETVVTNVKKSSKKKVKEKLNQIMNIDFDSLDSKLDEARTENDDLALQLLLVKKELSQKAQAINMAAEETLGTKVKRKTKTNKLTLDAITEKSEETTKYNEFKKQKLNYELRNRIVTETETSHLDEMKQKEYDALKAKLDAQKVKMTEAESKVERRQRQNGPIMDANKAFNNGLNSFLQKYTD